MSLIIHIITSCAYRNPPIKVWHKKTIPQKKLILCSAPKLFMSILYHALQTFAIPHAAFAAILQYLHSCPSFLSALYAKKHAVSTGSAQAVLYSPKRYLLSVCLYYYSKKICRSQRIRRHGPHVFRHEMQLFYFFRALFMLFMPIP